MGSSALNELRSIKNLRSVWDEFWTRTGGKSSTGVDLVTPQAFRDSLDKRLGAIHDCLEHGYIFSALRGVAIPKKDSSKYRLICVPTVADRLVQRALLRVIETRAESLGIINSVSFGFVRSTGSVKRGTHGARQAAVTYRQQAPWAFKADISSFFDNIQRTGLAKDFARTFKLRSLTPLVQGVIGCEVQADDDRVRRALAENNIKRGHGLRQGMPLSPTLSNFVLRDFDRAVGRNGQMVRYADDLILFAPSRTESEDLAALVVHELEKLGLTLSRDKTGIYSPEEPIEFLGMELCLGKGAGKYQLIVSKSQMKEIRSSFRHYHDFDAALREGLDAARLFCRLQQMQLGYAAAYKAADNLAVLEECLGRWVQECAKTVYESIFGRGKVSNLTAAQRRFLMIA